MSLKKVIDIILNLWNFIYCCYKYAVYNLTTGNSDSLACLVGKTAIVTGGSAGIGYATSALLASRGCKIIIASRRDDPEARDNLIKTTVNPNISFRNLDLASLKSVRRFAEDIRKTEEKIDILINNAGAGILSQKVSEDGLNTLMQTNFLGAFLLTHLLLEPMKAAKKARVIFITSGMALFQSLTIDNLNLLDYETNICSSNKLYSNSKFCNSLAAQEFGEKLRKHGIVVNAADTGAAKTDIYKKAYKEYSNRMVYFYQSIVLSLSRDPFNAAQTTFHLASSEQLDGVTGQVYFRCKPFPQMKKLKDQDFCDRIWQRAEELVQLRPEEKL